jgi:hypothetical protein
MAFILYISDDKKIVRRKNWRSGPPGHDLMELGICRKPCLSTKDYRIGIVTFLSGTSSAGTHVFPLPKFSINYRRKTKKKPGKYPVTTYRRGAGP